MSSGYEHLVQSLERRYDFLSARTVAMDALKDTGLEEKADYSDKELASIVSVLGDPDSRMMAVWGALGAAPEGVTLPAPEAPTGGASAEPEAKPQPKAKKAPAKKAAAKKSAAKKS